MKNLCQKVDSLDFAPGQSMCNFAKAKPAESTMTDNASQPDSNSDRRDDWSDAIQVPSTDITASEYDISSSECSSDSSEPLLWTSAEKDQ